MPRPLADAGLGGSLTLMALAMLNLRPLTVWLAVAGVACLVGAVSHHFSEAPKAPAEGTDKPEEAAHPPTPPPKEVVSNEASLERAPEPPRPSKPHGLAVAMETASPKDGAAKLAKVEPVPDAWLSPENAEYPVAFAREMTSRNSVIDRLRKLWIETHPSDAAMKSGLAWPPQDWMNARLEEMGFGWRLEVRGLAVATYHIDPADDPKLGLKRKVEGSP